MSTLQLGSLGAFSALPRLWCDRVDPVSPVVSPCVTKPVEVGGAEGQEAPPSSLTSPSAMEEVAATVVLVGGDGQEARRSELPSSSAPRASSAFPPLRPAACGGVGVQEAVVSPLARTRSASEGGSGGVAVLSPHSPDRP